MIKYKHIKSKFMLPKKKGNIIYRDRLLSKLDKALETKLTIISSPAGSGKTTSVISWLTLRNLADSAIWISLDERDNDPKIFWSCFVEVIEKLKESNKKKKEDRSSDENEELDLENVMEEFVNSLLYTEKEMILVLDDFHFIKDASILSYVRLFIDSIPDNVHLIITSRTKPRMNISKLRLDGEVSEIEWKDLSLTVEEASEFLNSMGIQLLGESVKVLTELTEGWIAGLQLAVLYLRENDDIEEMVKEFCGSNEYVQDYFIEEVFNTQSSEIIDFLLNTCILGELKADICNAVNSNKYSQQILEKLFEENIFIEKVDNDGKSFRYFKLFKEFLISKVSSINKEQIYEASSRAAEWYRENGLINDAINQYIMVENFEQVEKLVEEECIKKMFTNDYFYVKYWLENMPQDIVIKNPKLCIANMYVYLYDDAAYYKYLDICYKMLIDCTNDEYKAECVGTVYIIEGDKSLVRSEYDKAIEHYSEALKTLENNVFLSAIANLKLGIAYFYLKDFELEKKYLDTAALLSQSYQDDNLNLVVNRVIIFTKVLRGQLADCENICNGFLSNSSAEELKQPSLMAVFYIVLALVYYEKNDVNKAEDYLIKGMKLAEKQGEFYINYYTLCLGYCVQEAILMEKGNKVELDKINEKIDALSQKYSDNRLLDRYHFHKLKNYFEIFELARFMEYDKISFVEKRLSNMNFRAVEEMVVFAKTLILKDKIDDALMLINKVLNYDKEQNNRYLSIRAYIYRLEIFSQKDQYENAAKDLREALQIGYENGFIRMFLFKNIKMSRILMKLIKSMRFNKDYYKMGEYLNEVLELYTVKESNEILSKREKEVLLLIENGAKNSEIAQKLFISESTAKSHILNIFSKLGVRNRVQAVAKAKEIGIL